MVLRARHYLNTTGLVPAHRSISEHGTLKKSTEHVETLFIAFRQFRQRKMTSVSRWQSTKRGPGRKNM